MIAQSCPDLSFHLHVCLLIYWHACQANGRAVAAGCRPWLGCSSCCTLLSHTTCGLYTGGPTHKHTQLAHTHAHPPTHPTRIHFVHRPPHHLFTNCTPLPTPRLEQPLRNYLLGLQDASSLPNLAEVAPAVLPVEAEPAAKKQRVEGGCAGAGMGFAGLSEARRL